MWKLKLDENGKPVMIDGKPVYVKEDGTEVAVDVGSNMDTIARLNNEAKNHRVAKETAEANLAKFAGIADPVAALAALDTMSKLDQKKLIDAGEVDRVRTEISQGFQTKLTAAEERAAKAEKHLNSELIGGAFSRSKFIGDKMAIPADLVQARFGDAFAIEDGKVVAKDKDGNKLYSRSNPAELASFDESLEILVGGYAHKDHILKGAGASGSGAAASVAAGGKKSMSRTQFMTLDPQTQAKEVTSGTVITD